MVWELLRRISTYRNHKNTEYIGLACVVIGIIGLTWYLTEYVWIPEWQEGSLLFDMFHWIEQILGGNSNRTVFTLLAIWTGLSLVWILDPYKKYLFWVPIVFITTVLVTANSHEALGVPGVDELVLFVVAFVITIELTGVGFIKWILPPSHNRPFIATDKPKRVATWSIFLAVFFIIAVGFFEAHVLTSSSAQSAQHANLAVSLSASALLIYLFFITIRYTQSIRILFIGPARAGKTSAMTGLYHDIDNSKTDSNLLKTNNRKLKKGTLPDTTGEENTGYTEFEYISGHTFFRRKMVVSGFDYGGELLFGPESSQLVSALGDVRGSRTLKQRLLYRLRGHKKLWEETVDQYNKGDLNITIEEVPDEVEAVAKLADAANYVIITIPLEDFLKKVIVRETTRDYFSYFEIEKEAEGTYKVKPSGINEYDLEEDQEKSAENGSYIIERENGELKSEDSSSSDAPKPSFESEEYLLGLDLNKYYHVPDRERVRPEKYITQIKEFITKLQGERSHKRQFVWVFTMCDLVAIDFYKAYKKALEDEAENELEDMSFGEPTDGESFSIQHDTKYDSKEYNLFSYWIQKEYIEATWNDFEEVLAETREDRIYPVWYDIEQESETGNLKILTTLSWQPGADRKPKPKLFEGSLPLRDRIDGRDSRNSFFADIDNIEDMKDSLWNAINSDEDEDNG